MGACSVGKRGWKGMSSSCMGAWLAAACTSMAASGSVLREGLGQQRQAAAKAPESCGREEAIPKVRWWPWAEIPKDPSEAGASCPLWKTLPGLHRDAGGIEGRTVWLQAEPLRGRGVWVSGVPPRKDRSRRPSQNRTLHLV